MNKKMMALAVAGAFAAPAVALAQASSVQIYGRANLGVDTYKADGAANGSADFKSRPRVFDSSSRLGVRGSEDLGNGLRAIFQIESGVNFDTGSQAGQGGNANVSTGFFASRDSYGGIGGPWGDVRFGRQSYWWVNGVIVQTAANYINAEVPWVSGANLGRVAGVTARTSNTIQYNSPTVNGFNGSLNYTPNSEAAGAGASTDASIRGVTLRYSGIVNVQYDYARNQGPSGGANRLNIKGNKIGVGWPYAPGAQISAIWMQVKNDDVAGQALFSALHDNIKQNAFTLNWEHLFGNVQALAMASRLQKATGCTESVGAVAGVSGTTCSDTDATGYMLAAKYLLSKRTGIYVSYNRTNNKANQIADYTSSNITSVPAPAAVVNGPAAGSGLAPGQDPRIWAIGVLHNF
jgi:predicted porin